MAKFYIGEKSDKDEAIKELMIHAASVFDGRFGAQLESDDGGTHIVLMLEREEPAESLEPFLLEALDTGRKWMGWRYIIKKVPPGYIDAVVNMKKRDD